MLYKYMKFYDEILPELEQFSIDCQKKQNQSNYRANHKHKLNTIFSQPRKDVIHEVAHAKKNENQSCNYIVIIDQS